MKRDRFEKFAIACMANRYTKEAIANIAYEGDTKGIDYAIPQSWFNAHPECNSNSFIVTDCTQIGYAVIELRDLIPNSVADKIIRMAEIMKEMEAGKVEGSKFTFSKEKIFSLGEEYYALWDEIHLLMGRKA